MQSDRHPSARPRLSDAVLSQLPAFVGRPLYDRSAVGQGVVHLGAGAFHRAHQAVVFERALSAGDLRWGITAVSLRSPGVRDLLAPQDGLYTVQTSDGEADSLQCIGAILSVLVAPEDPVAVVAALARAQTHIVTLTVTEKGYHLDPATGLLDVADPEIAAELLGLDRPTTAIGFLVAGLAARRAGGLSPFTTISCDNISANGDRLRAAVLAMAGHIDPLLADWIAARAAFPNTMVDRIVPAARGEDIERLAALTGVLDRAAVKTEPFLQWIIEDRFCGPVPDFNRLGAQLTTSAAPWEQAKLRMLNGAHSAIAYLGGLSAISYVHEAVANPLVRRFIEALWDEVAATLAPPAELDLALYRQALMARFANPALQHATVQIAEDGTQKLPQRLLAPIGERLAAGQDIGALALATAAWMRWLCGRDDHGRPFAIVDPLAAVITERLRARASGEHPVDVLLGMETVFPPPLAADPVFRRALIGHFDALTNQGVMITLRGWLSAADAEPTPVQDSQGKPAS